MTMRQISLIGLGLCITMQVFFCFRTLTHATQSYVFNYNYNANYIIVEGGAPPPNSRSKEEINNSIGSTSKDPADISSSSRAMKEDSPVVLSEDAHTDTDDDESEHLKELDDSDEKEKTESEVEGTEVSDTSASSQALKKEEKDESTTIITGQRNHDPLSPEQLEDLQKKYYQRHYDAMGNTPDDDLLYWFRGNPRKFRGFFENFPYYAIEYDDSKWGNTSSGIDNADAKALHKVNFQVQSETSFYTNPFDIPIRGDPDAMSIVHFEEKHSLCRTAQFFEEYRKRQANTTDQPYRPWPHVAIVGMHRDFGAVSEGIKGVTYESNPRRKHWRQRGCSEDMIKSYINNPETLAVVTCQFHIWDHPKVHSIPLGMKGTKGIQAALKRLQDKVNNAPNPETATANLARRDQFVMVNFKEWKFFDSRKRMIRHLASPKFSWPNGTHVNTTNTYVQHPSPKNFENYLTELTTSKFVLSPSGWGIDCYRNYEALVVGNIPVIETSNRQDGWFRTFDDLPVAWIDTFDNLTPQWLANKYEELMLKWDTYNWEKVRKHWWIQWTRDLAKPANEFHRKQHSIGAQTTSTQ